jgi:hypothetical protein
MAPSQEVTLGDRQRDGGGRPAPGRSGLSRPLRGDAPGSRRRDPTARHRRAPAPPELGPRSVRAGWSGGLPCSSPRARRPARGCATCGTPGAVLRGAVRAVRRLPFASRTRYHWSVRVWLADGEASGPSRRGSRPRLTPGEWRVDRGRTGPASGRQLIASGRRGDPRGRRALPARRVIDSFASGASGTTRASAASRARCSAGRSGSRSVARRASLRRPACPALASTAARLGRGPRPPSPTTAALCSTTRRDGPAAAGRTCWPPSSAPVTSTTPRRRGLLGGRRWRRAAVLPRVHVAYADGSEQVIGSDET